MSTQQSTQQSTPQHSSLKSHPAVVLGILMLAFIGFAIETDIYVPGFPAMIAALGTSESQIQQLLSLNFLGICVSSLLCGPLSDAKGRRFVLAVGTSLFALASFFCALADGFAALCFWRLLQGLGAGSILAVACSAIFDLYDAKQSARLIAILNAVVTVVMAFAPLAGTWLNISFGWRAPFMVIFAIAAISCIAITFVLPESLPIEKRQKFNLRTVATGYGKLLSNRNFVCSTLAWNLMFAILVTYTANVSLLFIDHLHIPSAQFGFYQASTMSVFCLGSLAASYLIAWLGAPASKNLGTMLFFAGAVALSTLGCVAPESPALISGAAAIVGLGTAIGSVVYFADAMVGVENAGTAVSLAQATRLLSCSLVTDASRFLFDGTLGSLNLALGSAAVLGGFCILALPRETAPSLSTDKPQSLVL